MMTAEEFKQLFLPLRHILFRSAFRIVGTTQDAEDILQEVWLKLWQKRDTIPKDGNLTGFCVTLTRNQCVDFLRRQHLKTVDDEPAEHDAVQERSAQDEMEGNETRSSLMRIIDRLPEVQKRVIMMRDIEGLDYPDIVQATGLTEVNVRVSLSRARKHVREAIKQQMRQ